MKNWEDIEIRTDKWDALLDSIEKNRDYNPACTLIDYWDKRMHQKIWKQVNSAGRLPYGFVGDGWPNRSSQNWAIANDALGLTSAFPKYDYRDVGDAIYQANILLEYLNINPDKHYYIIDFGAGYGRLAIPFIYYYLGKMTYIGIDYAPVSLLIAPQFVAQAIDAKCRSWDEDGDLKDFDFVSLPAWRINELENIKADVFITIHSFQEMTPQAVEFYVDFAHNHADKGTLFYSINLWPAYDYVKPSWNLIFDRPYPINRDGSFNEKLWRIE